MLDGAVPDDLSGSWDQLLGALVIEVEPDSAIVSLLGRIVRMVDAIVARADAIRPMDQAGTSVRLELKGHRYAVLMTSDSASGEYSFAVVRRSDGFV